VGSATHSHNGASPATDPVRRDPSAVHGRRGGLWRQRNFALFWTGESLSEVGNAVTIIVMPLVAIDTLHTSTFVVTLLTAMTWIPWVIVGVPAGAWIDRLPPRPVMLACDAISLAVYASVPVAYWCGVLTVAQLVAVALIAGTATVFFRSAYQVLLPSIVDEADLTEGNAKLMGSQAVAQVGGPGLGGLLAQVTGPVGGVLADAISFGVSFCCLTALRAPRDRRSGAAGAGGMLEGLRFAWRDPYLRAITAFSSLANLALTGVDALLVVFLVRTVGLSSAAAGLVMAGFGVGGLLGALAARRLGRRFGTARAMLIAVAGGLCFALLLPLADKGPRLAFADIAMICAGCGIVVGNVIVASFMQTYVPPDIFGRVTSATRAVGFAMMPVGALLAGALATGLGVRGALWVLTAVIAATGLFYLLTPMRHLRDLPRRCQPDPPAQADALEVQP
jgi:predicted MFS family arabinose efflux permease